MNKFKYLIVSFAIVLLSSCAGLPNEESREVTAADILGNPDHPAFSYGGYRERTRDVVPTVAELKDDMKILSAMGVKVLRTYNTQRYAHAANLLAAIRELKDEDPEFEMYVMLGTWIECENAWEDDNPPGVTPNHFAGDVEKNSAEVEAAVVMANQYPDIVKMIAVGNEAMVQWAAQYFVHPNVIKKWVDYLQDLKKTGGLPADVWITSSDNFESWGGRAKHYHTDDLTALIEAVDFISLHTYPFHDTHYNPQFWGVPVAEEGLSDIEQTEAAMLRARNYAISQYQSVVDYVKSLGLDKPIHIGEIGWATVDNSFYGPDGAKAADEYKEKLFYDHIRDWTDSAGLSCFYFEAFDEKWKDYKNPMGSENHFGLINLQNEAKYALWELVDNGTFDGLTRNGAPITKTYGGDITVMMKDFEAPPSKTEMGVLKISNVNEGLETGDVVTSDKYILMHESLVPNDTNNMTYPSNELKLNPWDGTCSMEKTYGGVIEVITGAKLWWGAAFEIQGGVGENLSGFESGHLHFEIRGDTEATFDIGFQTGIYAENTHVDNFVDFGPEAQRKLTEGWSSYSIPVAELNKGANLEDVTAPLFVRSGLNTDGKRIYLKNIYYSRD